MKKHQQNLENWRQATKVPVYITGEGESQISTAMNDQATQFIGYGGKFDLENITYDQSTTSDHALQLQVSLMGTTFLKMKKWM